MRFGPGHGLNVGTMRKVRAALASLDNHKEQRK